MAGRRVVFEQRVETFQIDINDHVNNAIYVEWLEVGRIRMLEEIGLPVERLRERGTMPVLVETWIKYMEAVYYPDTVRVEVWVSELTRVTAWIAFRFYSTKTGKLVARAKQRGVFVTTDSTGAAADASTAA